MKMKTKLIGLLVVIALITPSILSAQDKKHEIEAGIGVFSINEIVDTFSDILVSIIPGVKMDDSESYGSLHLGYKYRPTDRYGIGGVFVYDYSTAKGVVNDVKTGKFINRHYTLAAEIDYTYFRSGNFSMYGLAGIGGTLHTQKYNDNDDSQQDGSDSQPYFTFQVTPVGLKYGNNFGGFAELGFGYRGIVSVGLFARF